MGKSREIRSGVMKSVLLVLAIRLISCRRGKRELRRDSIADSRGTVTGREVSCEIDRDGLDKSESGLAESSSESESPSKNPVPRFLRM